VYRVEEALRDVPRAEPERAAPAFPAQAAGQRRVRDEPLDEAGERTLEFKGLAYVQRWILPNLFFHVTTAYNILRHNGVEIGKRDFLGSP